MTLGLTRRSGRLPALLLAASLALGTATPLLAQEAPATPGSGPSSEIATELPPADLPTMNPSGYVFELESTFSGSLASVPVEAPVYAMAFPERTAEEAKAIAEKFGIDSDVEEQGTGTFVANGESGKLFVTPGLVQFISSQEIPEGDLPSDEQAIAFAREYLRQVGMLPANVGDGKIQARVDDPPRVVVGFQPVQPAPMLSASPIIAVTLGPQGAVLETSMRWADLKEGDLYQLRGADAAWTEVQSKRSYLEVSLPSDTFDPGSVITGTAEYTEVSLAYTSSGIPGEAQYLQPVYVFKGTVTPEGSDQSYPITAYVPALVNSRQPVG